MFRTLQARENGHPLVFLLKSLNVRLSCAALICGLAAGTLLGQVVASALPQYHPTAQSNRVAPNADFSQLQPLQNSLPTWVHASTQVASRSVNLAESMHLSVVLRRDPAVQAAFTQFLVDQQNPASPLYHQWLSPEQVGSMFGPTQSDINAVTNWLTSQGFSVTVSPAKNIVEAYGSIAVAANAFHASFGFFKLPPAAGSTVRFSVTSQPSIPEALATVIDSIHGLSEIDLYPQSHRGEPHSPMEMAGAASGVGNPNLTNGGSHYMTPADFNTIYDLNPVISGGNSGATVGSTAQHIAIIGRSRVSATDISEFAKNVSLGPYSLNTIVASPGVDPGTTEDSNQDEATLDVYRIIGTAPGAIADLIVSGTTSLTTSQGTGNYDGVYVAASYNVLTQKDPIMTISFGGCEINAQAAGVSLWDSLFSTAAAGGMSVFVSSGDAGAAGCDTQFVNPPAATAQQANSINYICASQYATCVGGTEFNDAANPSTYWKASSGSALYNSALSYIPEGAWNEPTSANTSSGFQAAASGGGSSTFVARPAFQTSATAGIAGNFRLTPDVSFASASHDGYYGCLDYLLNSTTMNCASGYFIDFEGTSAAAPGMAGIMALVNTKLGAKQGNFNTLLYKVHSTTPGAFHDVTTATSGVVSCSVTTPTMCNNSVPGSTSLTAGAQAGYQLLTGYDEVTGLGSLDVNAFITAAALASAPAIATATAITVTPNPVNTNQIATLKAVVTPRSTASAMPGGTVTFYSDGTAITGASAVALSTTAPYMAAATASFGSAGAHAITAIYSGDASYATSSSAPTSLTVSAGPTFSIIPASTVLGITSGAPGTDGITLTSLNASAGSVALSCSTTGIAGATCTLLPTPATLTSGGTASATLTVNAPAGTTGTMSVTVTGTSGMVVVSTTVAVTVSGPSFTVSPSPTALTIAAGATSGNTTVAIVSSINGFAGTVNIACSMSGANNGNAPTCSASSVTLTAGGMGSSTVTISSTAPHAGATPVQASVGGGRLKAGLIALGLFFLISYRRRRFAWSLAISALLMSSLFMVTGCSGGNVSSSGSSNGTKQSSAGTYTVTLTATSSGSSSSATTNFTVVIQ
jgi:pseudomonalisin